MKSIKRGQKTFRKYQEFSNERTIITPPAKTFPSGMFNVSDRNFNKETFMKGVPNEAIHAPTRISYRNERKISTRLTSISRNIYGKIMHSVTTTTTTIATTTKN